MENLNQTESEKNIKELIHPYILKWKYILTFVFVLLISAIVYLKFQVNKYQVTASVLVKDDQKNQVQNQLSQFSELGFDLGGVSSKIENEVEILKSRTLLTDVVKKLNLNITIYNEGTFKNKELFDNTDVIIKSLQNKENSNFKYCNFRLKIIDQIKFSFENLDTKEAKIYSFGDKIKLKIGSIIILPKRKNIIRNRTLLISISSINNTVDYFKKIIKIEPTNKESSSITLSMQYPNVEKAKCILNTIIKQHELDAINDKNLLNKNTLKFIDERLKYITDELSSVENNVSKFKSSNEIFDLNTNTSLYIQNESENENQLLNLNTQLNLAEYVEDYLISSNESDLMPANLGINNPGIEKIIESLNTLIIERNKLLVSSKDKNPIVSNLTEQIISLKSSLKQSLRNQKNAIKIQLKSFNKKNKDLKNKLNSAPKQEKDFKEIARQQQIKESLYLYLLQKREETSLSLAVTTSNTQLIDAAYSDNTPISPNRKIILLSAIILGLIFPIGIIYVKNLLDTKIKGRDDLAFINIPIIGELPLVKNNNLIIKKGDRSNIAEAVRIIRTNLNFLLSKNESNCKTIFVTSTFSSEGKSFVSINLASSLAMTDKKVLLIGLDLRMPKLLEYIGEVANTGVTNFIINQNLTLNDITLNSEKLVGVDIIPSGIIPPNPSELLMSDRMTNLLDEARTIYDYIIVDTAPVGLVTDTLLIKDFADVTLYITRANVLEKKSLAILKDIYDNKKLLNITALINGVDLDAGYGYGYGYGYGNEINVSRKNKILSFFNLNRNKTN